MENILSLLTFKTIFSLTLKYEIAKLMVGLLTVLGSGLICFVLYILICMLMSIRDFLYEILSKLEKQIAKIKREEEARKFIKERLKK